MASLSAVPGQSSSIAAAAPGRSCRRNGGVRGATASPSRRTACGRQRKGTRGRVWRATKQEGASRLQLFTCRFRTSSVFASTTAIQGGSADGLDSWYVGEKQYGDSMVAGGERSASQTMEGCAAIHNISACVTKYHASGLSQRSHVVLAGGQGQRESRPQTGWLG